MTDKKLGPVLATFLVAGNMIGSGVYLLPATLGAIGGVSVWGWAIAGLGALVLAAVFSLLSRVRPTSGGVVAYAGEGLGRFFGFQGGYLYWLSCWVGNVAIAVAVTGYAGFFAPALKAPGWAAASTIAVIWLLTAANLIGPRFVGKLQGATLAVGLVPVVAAAILGWLWFDPALFAASWNVSGAGAAQAVQMSLASVFWAFLGLESASLCAAVVRNPERNVPIATLGGVALAAGIYILAVTAIMGVIPAADLARSTAPFADVVARVAGPAAAALVAACALAKAGGTLGGWLLVTGEASRWTAAAGYLPSPLARTRSDGTPARALVVMAVVMSGVALATMSPTIGEQFGVLINVAVVFSLVVYAYCCLALLRFSAELGPRSRGAARAAALVGLGFCLWLTAASGTTALGVLAGVLAATALLWLALRRRAPAPAALPG